jgi:exodeoxyribonuclease V alpha subunit
MIRSHAEYTNPIGGSPASGPSTLCGGYYFTSRKLEKTTYENLGVRYVRGLDLVEQTLTVDFDGRTAIYDWSEADELTLAYVVSIHKAQGSEFPVVVMPIVTQHYTMLQRNLLYTAIIRAKKVYVLAGNPRAISMAVRNNKVAQRFTALEWRLGKV